VWRLLAADRHRRGAGAHRADSDRGRSVSRLDELPDLDDVDHDHLAVHRRRFFLLRVWFGLVSDRILGHIGFVRRDVGHRCNGLERNQRLGLDRRIRTDRRGRDPQRCDRRRELGIRIGRFDQRRRRPAVGGGLLQRRPALGVSR
jgi:hypothetical protein